VCGTSIAARSVSGDFYDILPLAGSRIAFCVGDVAGQGLHAVLLMAKTASLYRCLAKRIASPSALLTALDVEISQTATRGSFVKLIAGIYDPACGEVVFANAGLEPLLLHGREGGFTAFPAGAPPLGSEARGAFPETRMALDGGTLYVYSEGLIAATCAESPERLQRGPVRLILRFANKPPAARIAAIASDLGRVELGDDLTCSPSATRAAPGVMNARVDSFRSAQARCPAGAPRRAPERGGGADPDTPLSLRGVAQAERLAARLAELSVARILSSDLARARMTAERVQAAARAALELEPLLQERNFGDLAGSPTPSWASISSHPISRRPTARVGRSSICASARPGGACSRSPRARRATSPS
jgi:hypothetical protein